MFKRRFLLIVFASGLFVSFSAQALLPVIIYSVARQAAVMTAESVAVDVIARGFAANHPYVRTTATMGRKTFAARLAALRGSRWAGAGKLALALGVALGFEVLYEPEKGFYQNIPYNPDVRGRCLSGWSFDGTLQACLNAFAENGVVGVARVEVSGNDTLYYFRYSSGDDPLRFIVYGSHPEPVLLPLTSEQIDSALPALFANSSSTWGDYLDGMSQSDLAKLFDGATIPYNPTSPNPQLEKWKNDYRQGLLQSTDPEAPNYVTPEQLQQVKDLVAAEDLAKTDDGTIAALNEQIKQPITQAQYDESNLKTETAQAASLSSSLAPALDPFNQLKIDSDFVLDKINNPAEPPASLSFFTWSLPTGTCTGFDVDFSVGNGRLHTSKRVNEFCEFYSTVAHPLLFWFLNILTFLYVWWVWDRSVSDMAR